MGLPPLPSGGFSQEGRIAPDAIQEGSVGKVGKPTFHQVLPNPNVINSHELGQAHLPDL